MLLALLGLLGAAIGVPLAALAYWFVEGSSSTLPPTSVLHDTVSTVGFSATAGRDESDVEFLIRRLTGSASGTGAEPKTRGDCRTLAEKTATIRLLAHGEFLAQAKMRRKKF